MSKMKKVLAFALMLCLVLTLAPGAALADDAEAPPMLISAAPSTRAAAIAELYALEGEPAFMNANVFTDVPEGSDFEKAIVWASGKNIVNGYGDGLFGPDDAITREQFVTILWRYACYKELDVSAGEDTNILSYNDAFDIKSYAYSAFQWACAENITEDTDGNLNPAAVLTADEITDMIERFSLAYELKASAPAIAGGWSVSTGSGSVDMPDGAAEALELAVSKLVGASYKPLAYLGSQVVAGINYAYLCAIKPVVPNAAAHLSVVIVYKDLSGDATVTKIRDISIADYTTESGVSFPEAGKVGGWTIWNESSCLLPEDAKAAYEEAMSEILGVGYNPVAFLGTQVVAGVNYAFLCTATLVGPNAETALAVVIVTDPVSGEGASVLSIADFSIQES